jgi:hypothetical protein
MSEPASIASIGGNPQVLETLSAAFSAPGAHPAQAEQRDRCGGGLC